MGEEVEVTTNICLLFSQLCNSWYHFFTLKTQYFAIFLILERNVLQLSTIQNAIFYTKKETAHDEREPLTSPPWLSRHWLGVRPVSRVSSCTNFYGY